MNVGGVGAPLGTGIIGGPPGKGGEMPGIGGSIGAGPLGGSLDESFSVLTYLDSGHTKWEEFKVRFVVNFQVLLYYC